MSDSVSPPLPDQTADKTVVSRSTISAPTKKAPRTQERNPNRRMHWPEWTRQMPRVSFPPVNETFQLVDPAKMKELTGSLDSATQQRITNDLKFLDEQLLKQFQQHDHESSLQQNRYRLYQIGFIVLATAATIVGSLQSLALGNDATLVPILAFVETVIALVATYLATVAAREPPLERWMVNRQRAEGLRREYFRYLLCLPPYDTISEEYKRRHMLRVRSADIDRGVFPQESLTTQG